MSEFTKTKAKRILNLKEVSNLILKTGNAKSFIDANKEFIPTVIPTDFIELFDEIIKEGYKMDDIKVLTNKVLNIFYESIRDYKRIEPEPDSFLGVLEQNNHEMELVLNKIRPVFKAFVKDISNKEIGTELAEYFKQLEIFEKHYTIKENVLFPIIEKTWDDGNAPDRELSKKSSDYQQ